MTRPSPQWEAFAAREPYFAVLTSPRFLTANLTDAGRQEFFDSGDTLVGWMFDTIERHLVPEFSPMSILEYGCGAGRLAVPLARRGAAVTAVDHSPAMLDVARREAERHSQSIRVLEPDALWAAPGKFDLVTCYLLFQRLAPAEGLALLQDLLGCLGPGGAGVFQFPYRVEAGTALRASRWAREHVPGVNQITNLVRGRPARDPFVPSHPYDLATVCRVLDGAGVDATWTAFEHHEGFGGVVLFVRAPEPPGTLTLEPAPDEDRPIDVREVIAHTSLDDLNRAAEDYFESLTEWDHHLAKPFNNPSDTPLLLTDVVTLLQGLRLWPGANVLEFGAGTGWLSRIMTQLGCRVTLLDVSPTALRMARELYRRLPIIGDKPTPDFLQFDGRTIDLPDASVDRIVSFHAFHHAPNPADVIREFGRVLKPGGIAGFAEPGPRHSRSPLSQFEMRTYQVVEQDVDMQAIWRAAQGAGFSDLKLAVFHAPPFHVSLEEYGDLLAGGATGATWVTSTREFVRHVRSFFLVKEGHEPLDSRTRDGLACEIEAVLSAPAVEGLPITFDALVKNTGIATWLPPDAAHGAVLLGVHLYDGAGNRLQFDIARQAISANGEAFAPGATAHARLTLPPQAAGRYIVEFDCVAADVIWFAQCGSHPARLRVEVLN